MTEYVYEVRSDVPLSLVNATGNIPALVPVGSGGLQVQRDFRRVLAGPQAAPATSAARLVSDGSEVVGP